MKVIDPFNGLGCDKLHVIVAKAPNPLSDEPGALGRPRGFGIDADGSVSGLF